MNVLLLLSGGAAASGIATSGSGTLPRIEEGVDSGASSGRQWADAAPRGSRNGGWLDRVEVPEELLVWAVLGRLSNPAAAVESARIRSVVQRANAELDALELALDAEMDALVARKDAAGDYALECDSRLDIPLGSADFFAVERDASGCARIFSIRRSESLVIDAILADSKALISRTRSDARSFLPEGSRREDRLHASVACSSVFAGHDMNCVCRPFVTVQEFPGPCTLTFRGRFKIGCCAISGCDLSVPCSHAAVMMLAGCPNITIYDPTGMPMQPFGPLIGKIAVGAEPGCGEAAEFWVAGTTASGTNHTAALVRFGCDSCPG